MKLRNYAAMTHQGPLLEVNEDGYDFDLDNQFFMVLDGFGGSGIGDKAVTKLKEEIKRFLGRLAADPDSTMPLYWNARWLLEANALINSLLLLTKNLYQENNSKPLNQRAGASMACAIKADDILILAFKWVAAFHIWFAEEKWSHYSFQTTMFGLLGPSRLSEHAVAASAFGFYPELTWSIREVKVQEGDQFALFTDGVAPWIEQTELGHVLSRTDEDLQEKLNGLLKLSNARGNNSNQTGMILEF